MAEKITPEQRSKVMQSIRSVSKLESLVSKELWKKGYRFRRNYRGLPGTPDISIKKYKVVIFVDSCFWHWCDIHGHVPKSNVEFWVNKLTRNKNRDQRNNEFYKENGWHILRIWEHDIRADLETVVSRIASFIDQAKHIENLSKSEKKHNRLLS